MCEQKLVDGGSRMSVRNSPVVILLIKWLPDIDSELQSWLSSMLYQICTADTWSLNQCCNDGINAAILDCLLTWNELDTKTVGRFHYFSRKCFIISDLFENLVFASHLLEKPSQ